MCKEESLQFEWLDSAFLQAILKNDPDIKEPFKICNFHCEFASKTGENYSSILYRLRISYTLKNEDISKSYIVKCMQSPDSEIGKTMKTLGIYRRESAMYSETLPSIKEVLKVIDPELQLAPKFIHMITEPCEILVIEDLQPIGFKVADRLVGMDHEHSKMVFKNLARMHAASMYLNKKNPQFRRHYNEGAFNENMSDTMATYFKNGVYQATEVMKQRPKCQKYVKAFEDYSERLIEDGITLLKEIPAECNEFNVLNQGDIWINNIMFKYNEDGEPIDIRFVDFQMSHFGCPGIDINYFFCTSLTNETRSIFRNDLLILYHSVIVETLNSLQYDGFIPTIDRVHKELLRSKDIALMSPCIVLPLVKLSKDISDTMTTDNLMNKETTSDSRTSLYDNKLYQESLEIALENLETIGFLNT